jgi:ATP-binding cassette subfamily C (CFTR/MRP) protein 1
LSTIRAFGLQNVFTSVNEHRIDRNSACFLPSTSVNRWLALRLEIVGATIIFIASSLSMITLVTGTVDAGLVGLVISYALNTTSSLASRSVISLLTLLTHRLNQNWLVRSASEVEQNIVSVERMLQYIELDPEAPYEIPDAKPEGEWPSAGDIKLKGYSLRYRPELDLALKEVSLHIVCDLPRSLSMSHD